VTSGLPGTGTGFLPCGAISQPRPGLSANLSGTRKPCEGWFVRASFGRRLDPVRLDAVKLAGQVAGSGKGQGKPHPQPAQP